MKTTIKILAVISIIILLSGLKPTDSVLTLTGVKTSNSTAQLSWEFTDTFTLDHFKAEKKINSGPTKNTWQVITEGDGSITTVSVPLTNGKNTFRVVVTAPTGEGEAGWASNEVSLNGN